jgi:signal transduction histidine kinase/HD-GYP domain-containing protein (c-di-GMP phosphodiesterase class II)
MREGKSPPLVSIPQARLIELVAMFAILYVAKEIAGFSYNTGLVVTVFLVSAFLNVTVSSLRGIFRNHGSAVNSQRIWSWLVVMIDLATVLTLVYLTGTVNSPFMFLVVVPLFFAGRLLPAMTAGFAVTFVSTATIATLGLLELKGIIPHNSVTTSGYGGPAEPHYLMGTLLVVGGFMSLMTYLFSTFYDNFQVYFRDAEQRLNSSRQRILELTRLYDISLGINSVISLDTLLKMVCKEVTLLLRRPWAAVALMSPKGEVVKFIELGAEGISAEEPESNLEDDPLLSEMTGREKGLTLGDVSSHSSMGESPLIKGRGLVPVLVVPILSGHDSQGVLLVGDRENEPFTDEDVKLMSILSGQVSTAIEKSRLYEVMTGRIRRLERENEGLENSNKLKMGYISHVSHELKTPLTSIKAYVESLAENIDDPGFTEGKDFLGVITNETDRLIRLVNKVLDISKIEFGQRTLRRKLFDLRGLIREVESSMQPYMMDKNLRLIVEMPEELPNVDGDEDLVKQVLINLIGNAVKFSSPGSRIFLGAEEEAISIKVTVRDEGVGIPEEDLRNIFKQFYQVGGDSSEGVGLGLAIVKNIVEQHGGYVQVSSEMNEGSTFSFTLPKEHHFNDLLGYIFDSMEARDEIQDMFQLAVKVVAEILSAKIVSMMLLDRERKELFIKVAYGLDEKIVENARVKMGKSIAGRVAETGEPLLIEDIEETSLAALRSNNPQYETKSLLSVPLIVGSTVIGVINANNKTSGKPFTEDDLILMQSISQRIAKVIERMRTAEDFHAFLHETISSLNSLLEICEADNTGMHKKMVEWSVKVARKLGLGEKEIQVIQFVSSVHDVGMTTISDDILSKTLELTPEEVDEIRKHPQRSATIMRPFEFVEAVSQTILFHHEKMDGTGYPMGLKGEQIPVGSRIIAVLDAWISMMSERPFRKTMDISASIDELVENVGSQFDREVVGAFMEVLVDEGRIEIEEYAGIRDRLRFGGRHHAMP